MSPAKVAVGGNKYIRVFRDALTSLDDDVRHWSPVSPGQCADVFHIHWPEAVFDIRAMQGVFLGSLVELNFWNTIARVKRRGGLVTWTAHNLVPHDSALANSDSWKEYFQRFLTEIDCYFPMSSSGQLALVSTYPQLMGKPYAIVPHPSYAEAMPAPNKATPEWRNELPTDAVVAGCIGSLTQSKGIIPLVERFMDEALPQQYLVLAGHCEAIIREKLVELVAQTRGKVMLFDRRLSDQEVSNFHSALDLVVFYSRDHLNSGTVVQAISQGVKIVCFKTPMLEELFGEVGLESPIYFDDYEGNILGSAIADGVESQGGYPDISTLSPTNVARTYKKVWSDMLA